MGCAGRRRKNAFLVRLTEQEMEQLTLLVERSGLSREALIRKLIRQEKIYEIIPLDYNQMKKQLQAIGRNLNQVARIANATGDIRSNQYEQMAIQLKMFLSNLDNKLLGTIE